MTKYSEVIHPEKMVEYVVRNNMQDRIKLPNPRPAKEIQCPDCGSSNGFYNPSWYAWACNEPQCLWLWLPSNSALKHAPNNKIR